MIALVGDRAVGAEVAHEPQHRARARGRERPSTGADIGDEQVDGVRTDVEDSQAHGTTLPGAPRARSHRAMRDRGIHPPDTMSGDVRRRRSHDLPALSLYREIDRARMVASRRRDRAAADRDRGRADPRHRRPPRHGRGVARSTCRCRGCCRCTRGRPSGSATTSATSSVRPDTTTPFVVGVAGSVAVGKSTIARLLRELMSRWPDTPRVELVTTDGFLYPNAELERRGHHGPQGLPRVLRPPRAGVVPHRGQERRGRGARAVLLAHAVRHRARTPTSPCDGPTW